MTSVEELASILKKLEETFHERGEWDIKPAFIVIADGKISYSGTLIGEGKGYEIASRAVRQNEKLCEYIRESDAIAIVDEGWAYPAWIEDLLLAGGRQEEEFDPPSSYEDRREVRMVVGLSKNDDVVFITRIRDEEPIVRVPGGEDNLTGYLIDTFYDIFDVVEKKKGWAQGE